MVHLSQSITRVISVHPEGNMMFEACFMKTHYYSATNCVTTEYHRGPQPQASTWTNSHQFSPSVKAFPLPSSDIRWKQGIKTPQSRKNTDEIRFKRPSWKRANTHSLKHQRDLSTPANNLTFSYFSCSVATAGSSACLIRQFVVLYWWGLASSAGIEPVTPAVKLRSPTDKCHSSNKVVQLSKLN